MSTVKTVRGPLDIWKYPILNWLLKLLEGGGETTYTVTVEVTDTNGNAVQDANIALGQVVGRTNSSGIATLNIAAGTYTMTVSASGYANYEETVTVSQNSTVSVVLTPTGPTISPTLTINPTSGPPGNAGTVTFSGTGYEPGSSVLVEWWNSAGAMISTPLQVTVDSSGNISGQISDPDIPGGGKAYLEVDNSSGGLLATAVFTVIASQPPPPPPSQFTATARFIDPITGQYVISDTINPGQNMDVSTVVPSNSTPVTIQGFIKNPGSSTYTPGAVFNWDIQQTGYNYIIQYGPAPDLPGTYEVHTVVTFGDGSQTQSNDVEIIIVREALSLSASTTSLPSSGGTVTFSGTASVPNGYTIDLMVTSPLGSGIEATITIENGAFSNLSESLPGNTSAYAQQYTFWLSDPKTGVTSNQITVTVAAATPSSSGLYVTMTQSTYFSNQVPEFSGSGATPNGTVDWSITSVQAQGIIQSGSVTATSTGTFTGSASPIGVTGEYILLVTDVTTGLTAQTTFYIIPYRSPT